MTYRRIVAGVSALCLVSGFASVARAGAPPEDAAFQTSLFGRAIGKGKAHACFSRVYDADHLTHHPQQNVRTMLLLVTGDASDVASPTYNLGLGVTFRKTGTHFETSGDCGALHNATSPGESPKVAHCGVDCDGGAIDVSLENATSVLVAIPAGARIWKAGSTDDVPGDERKRFGSDDKVFRLGKTALTDCLSLVSEAKDKAALRRGQ